MNHEYGDTVKIQTDEEIYEGILMPRPAIFEKDHTIIKLGNGYNIGIKNTRIKRIELIKKYEPKKQEKAAIKFREGLATVSILSCGGTISSKVDYRTGGVHADYTAQDFISMIPELQGVANLKAARLMSLMSEDISPEDWQMMARGIAKELNDDKIDGVVVTHGTDTLHYSTAAMSFFLRDLNKPVVFTGAQRSIDRGSSDAFLNLLCSVNTAAKFDGACVMTCMHGTSSDDYCILNRGTKVRKMHTSRRDAFRPINELPLAKVHANGTIEVMNGSYKKRNLGKTIVDEKFEHKTALVHVYPGMDPGIFDYYIEKKFRGIVIAATALGHVPTVKEKYSIIGKIAKMMKSGIEVVIASQTIYGRVHPYVYTNLRKLSVELGCIFAGDMLPETAYVKLGWVLGHTDGYEEVKKMMLTNYANEISEISSTESFLF